MTSTSSPQIVDLSEESSSMRQSMEFNSASTPIGVDLGPEEEANLTSATQDTFQLPFEKKKWEHVFQSKAKPETARKQSKPPQLDLELDEHMAKPVGVSLAPDKVHGVLGGTSSTFTEKNARGMATDKIARKRKANSEKNNSTKDVALKKPDLALKKPKRKSKELMKTAGSSKTKAKQTQDASRPSDENCNDYLPVKKRAVSYAGQQLSNVIDISDDQDEVEDVIQILEDDKQAAANRKVVIIDLTEDETDCMAPARKRSVTALHCFGESAKQDSTSTRRDTDRKASKRQEPERRYVFHSAPKKSHRNANLEWQKHNFNATLSNEDAAREQERLFRESAARVKSQARFQVIRTHDPRKIAFPQPLANVHQKFPEHWTFFNTYSRLGLHQEAPLHLVKLHYRTLARIYHPDKSGTDDTTRKFQAITEAYTTIVTQGS